MPARPLTEAQLEAARRLRDAYALAKQTSPSLTQEAIAHACGWKTQGAVSQYMLGKIPLNLSALLKLSAALGVAPGDIYPELASSALHDMLGASSISGPRGTTPTGDAISQATQQLTEKPWRSASKASNVGSPLRPVLSWEHEEELPPGNYVFIPRLTIEASCGNGKIVWHIDEKGQRNAFRRSWVDRLGINPQKCATIVASGDSMEERICDGDSLVLDYSQNNVLDGKVYAITYGGEVFVKRLFKRPSGGLRIVSDNQDKTRYPDWDVDTDRMENLQIIGRVVAISGGL